MEQVLETLPISIQRVINYAVDTLMPKRIYLYGSRARGNARELSDYDLAFEIDDEKRAKWNRFLSDVDELPLTLLPVDYVELRSAPKDLREEILRTGRIIYESE